MKSNKWFVIFGVSMGLFLALLLLWPHPVEGTPIGRVLAKFMSDLLDPTHAHSGAVYNTLEKWLNFLIFVPFAFCLFLGFKKHRWIWGVGLSVIVSVLGELAQLIFLPERVASIVDVLLNASGALLGAALAWLVSAQCTRQ